MNAADEESLVRAEVVVVANDEIGLISYAFFPEGQLLIRLSEVFPVNLATDLHSFAERRGLANLAGFEIDDVMGLARDESRDIGIGHAVLV